MRRLFLTSVLGLVLAGCATPERVVKDLPPPFTAAQPPRASLLLPPTPRPPPLEAPATRALREATIVIDAGHGGKDPGAPGRWGSCEKTIVLAVAKQAARLLADRGATIIMTRTSDVFIELDDRAATAERSQADLLVSIHADAAPNNSDASGASLYIARSASLDSQRAARSIASALKRAGIEYRGLNRAGFRVLVGHSRPAVLVECGFLTNAGDARLLSTPSYRSRIAAALAEGIANHFSQ